MARLEDLLQGLRLEDLPEEYADLAPILTALDSAITALGNAVRGNLTLADNVAVEKLDVQLTHGVSQTVALKKLRRVGSVIGCSAGLDANGTAHAFLYPPEVKPATASGMAQAIAYFRDPTAKRVQCTLLVEPGGTSTSKLAPSGYCSARYETAAGQSITNGAADIVIDFGTKDTDTDAAVTTGASWHFTVPAGKGGDYFMGAQIAYNTAPTSPVFLDIYRNAAQLTQGVPQDPGAQRVFATQTMYTLTAGDTIDFRTHHNTVGAVALQASGLVCFCWIYRILGS